MEAPRETGLELQQELELFPGRSVSLLLFNGVQNAAALRKKAMEGAVEGALLNPAMVRGSPEPRCWRGAVRRAAGGPSAGAMSEPARAWRPLQPLRVPSASCEGSSV